MLKISSTVVGGRRLASEIFPPNAITINKHGKEEEPSDLRCPWS